ncbi:MAG: HAMP domain-containing protein, partial [Candidatus Hydrogenedentota bacterium]
LYSMAKTKNFVLPKQSYGVFQGYYNQLFEWSQGKEISEKFIEQSFRKMYNWMRYYRKKLEKYQKQQKHFAQKEVKWNQKIQKVLRKLKGRFPAFYKAIEGQPLQNQILMMQPVHSMQDRLYRGNVTDHYIGYVFVFKGNIYEIGLPYTEYRKFMHDPTLAMIWILMGASFVILFGFRFFFAGTLVNPLNRLLEGVSKVNEGNLNVSVKVGVEDEIGFLTRSFNDMVISIRTAQEKLQEYANSLEEKVKERTLELQKTLEEVQALKVQQDGDYFLTSRLINPLGRNNATGEFTKVEFIVKQKKHFQFRKWEAEIGGDICMAHTLYLDDEKYIFFLNADAMGKSIQGAGGALVLGAVMESIIQRTNLSKEARHTSPEKWLYYTFIELQKVFESFDGAMLISMIMGLVHDQSGFLYFLNAEHPWAVLYRDGRSEFLENELAIRKVGFMGAEFSFSIKTFSMAKGDAIFLGSDGKDDLVLPNGTVNEDETLFLRVLNEAKGELEKIPEVLQKHGKLMDDLSVMKITWEGKEPLKHLPEEDQKKLRRAKKLVKIGEYEQALSIFKALHAQYPDADFIVHDIVYTFSQKQDYAQMAGYAIYGMRVFPADEELMYKASYASKMAGDYNTAADIGERLRLRNPTHFRNLINVANVHLLLGNLDRATQLLEEAKAIDPENPKIEELMQAIEKLYPDT